MSEAKARELLQELCGAYHSDGNTKDQKAAFAAARAYLAAVPAPPAGPRDPLDWPLPCDVTIGHGTHKKGTSLRLLEKRANAIYEMARDYSARQQTELQKRVAAPAAEPRPDVYELARRLRKIADPEERGYACNKMMEPVLDIADQLVGAPATEPVAQQPPWDEPATPWEKVRRDKIANDRAAETVFAAQQPEAPTLPDDELLRWCDGNADGIEALGFPDTARRIRECAKRIRELEADIENAVWNLGGCDCFANGWAKPDEPVDESMARPALLSVRKMASDLAASRERERAAKERGDGLWQQCENLRIALRELYDYQLPTRALNLIHAALATPDSAASP